MNWLLSHVPQLGTGALFLIVVLLALRKWISLQAGRAISHLFDARLESHKARLKTESDAAVEQVRSQLHVEAERELEELRSALAREGNRQQVVHGELIRRRFDAIAEVHGALLAMYESVRQLVDPTARDGVITDKECSARVWDASQEFDRSYRQQRIFLSKPTADLTGKLRQQLVSNANLYQLHVKNPQTPNPYQAWIDVYESVSKDVQLAIDRLEAELRALMGDDGRVPQAHGASP